MGYPGLQPTAGQVWALARAQDDVVSRNQLLRLGFHRQAIKHRLARGRLHALWPGVYAVGNPIGSDTTAAPSTHRCTSGTRRAGSQRFSACA